LVGRAGVMRLTDLQFAFTYFSECT
jgi:hypothetical protein